MVYRKYSLQGMESDRLSPLGPWKMYVFFTIPAPTSAAYASLIKWAQERPFFGTSAIRDFHE